MDWKKVNRNAERVDAEQSQHTRQNVETEATKEEIRRRMDGNHLDVQDMKPAERLAYGLGARQNAEKVEHMMAARDYISNVNRFLDRQAQNEPTGMAIDRDNEQHDQGRER